MNWERVNSSFSTINTSSSDHIERLHMCTLKLRCFLLLCLILLVAIWHTLTSVTHSKLVSDFFSLFHFWAFISCHNGPCWGINLYIPIKWSNLVLFSRFSQLCLYCLSTATIFASWYWMLLTILMPGPCISKNNDISFSNIFYSKDKRPGSPAHE